MSPPSNSPATRSPFPSASFARTTSAKTKNVLEAELVAKTRERTKNAGDLQLLQSIFAKMRRPHTIPNFLWPDSKSRTVSFLPTEIPINRSTVAHD